MRCPICKKSVSDATPGAESPKYFPFCSERCKLIDLGRWLDGKYHIPVTEHDGEDVAADDEGGRDAFSR